MAANKLLITSTDKAINHRVAQGSVQGNSRSGTPLQQQSYTVV